MHIKDTYKYINNKPLLQKPNAEESSNEDCVESKDWDDEFCEDDYSDPPYFDDNYYEANKDKLKKSKEHKQEHCKERLIKCNSVVARRHVQKVGTLSIPAPIGVGIDKSTGKLTTPVILEPFGEPVFTPKVINSTLINEGFVPVRIIVKDVDPEPCPNINKGFKKLVYIPFQSEIEIKDIKLDDDIEENIDILSLAVFGFPNTSPQGGKGTITQLILKVILTVEIIVTRECFLPIDCKPHNYDF
jgi:hypothetical protein